MNNKKQNILIIVGLIVLVGMIGAVSFAFFNYTRTGSANTIRVGRVTFDFTQDQTINLSNMFPIDPTVTGIMDDETKVGTLEINIEGDTDYADGLEYLITTTNSRLSVNGKVVPISIDVTISNGLGTSNDNYFTARESKNATIYKRLSGDVVVGDQQLLVGYIKPNTTRGDAEGVTGSITIKAYFDKNRIAISDTYDDTGIVSALNGTTSEWVDDRVYLTTTEWNSLQTNGISFQVRVEANEGIWVDEPIYNKLRMNAVMDNIASRNVSSATGIDFSKISGDTDGDNVIDNGEGLYVRAGTENDAYPIVYFRGNVTDNNVYFEGMCWQMVRTTDTGGVKMIYNGIRTGTDEAPTCNNTTGASRQITLSGVNKFAFSGTNLYNSPAYNGYMYKTPVYSVTDGDYASGSKFGNGVVYNETSSTYTLIDVSDNLDANHHYTCGTAGDTVCSTVRYYYTYFTISGTNIRYYFTLTNGKTIEDVVAESLGNGTAPSNAKTQLETWYEEKLSNTEAESKIEDTVYCNDRSIYSLGGMNPNGGAIDSSAGIIYSGYNRNYVTFNPSTKCQRVADSFTKNSTRGNGLLGYSAGLITADEIALAGGKLGTANANFYLNTGANYWSLSPFNLGYNGNAGGFSVGSSGRLSNFAVNSTLGLRPVVSLKLGTSIASGDGTGANPYLIK